jgi:undecaprenyl-diphosphatase
VRFGILHGLVRPASDPTTRRKRLQAAGRAASPPIALLAGLYVFAVGTASGRRLDVSGLHPFADSRLWLADVIEQSVNVVSAPVAALVLAAIAYRRRGLGSAVVVGLLLAGANLTAGPLKAALGAVDLLGGEDQRALGAAFFPSGHATAAMSLGLALTIALDSTRPGARAGIWFAAAAGVAIVATSSHHPSDVMGGYLVAGAWAAAVTSLFTPGQRATITAAVRPTRRAWWAIGACELGAPVLWAGDRAGVVAAPWADQLVVAAAVVGVAVVTPLLALRSFSDGTARGSAQWHEPLPASVNERPASGTNCQS